MVCSECEAVEQCSRQYTDAEFRTWAVAVALGPIVGGALAEKGDWRWLFCEKYSLPAKIHTQSSFSDLNLPVCGVACILVVLFMDLPTPKGTFKEKWFAMDWM